MNYTWPLNDSQFTWVDRIRICKFFLNTKNRWTQDVYVKEFEKTMSKFVGAKYAVFVSSGSTANNLVAMWAKDHIFSNEKNIAVFPSVTWTTSLTPFIREGFKPAIIDINLTDLSIDLDKLEEYLKENYKKVAIVFITSLLGFCPDIERIKDLEKKYSSVKFALDACEATLTKTSHSGIKSNISKFFTSTTSTYFGHILQSIEGGFIFTNDLQEYLYYLMQRNHGLTRALLSYRDVIGEENLNELMNMKKNLLVDSRFDFYSLGNNFRNSEVNAFIGLQDFKRIGLYEETRSFLYSKFLKGINKSLFLAPKDFDGNPGVPFSIPVIFNPKYFGVNVTTRNKCIEELEKIGVETRPIVSGNLLRQTAYQSYGHYLSYPNAEVLNNNGLYVGLHAKVANEQVEKLINIVNKLAEDLTKI